MVQSTSTYSLRDATPQRIPKPQTRLASIAAQKGTTAIRIPSSTAYPGAIATNSGSLPGSPASQASTPVSRHVTPKDRAFNKARSRERMETIKKVKRMESIDDESDSALTSETTGTGTGTGTGTEDEEYEWEGRRHHRSRSFARQGTLENEMQTESPSSPSTYYGGWRRATDIGFLNSPSHDSSKNGVEPQRQASLRSHSHSQSYSSLPATSTTPVYGHSSHASTSTTASTTTNTGTSGPFRHNRWTHDAEDGESVILKSPSTSTDFKDVLWARESISALTSPLSRSESLNGKTSKREKRHMKRMSDGNVNASVKRERKEKKEGREHGLDRTIKPRTRTMEIEVSEGEGSILPHLVAARRSVAVVKGSDLSSPQTTRTPLDVQPTSPHRQQYAQLSRAIQKVIDTPNVSSPTSRSDSSDHQPNKTTVVAARARPRPARPSQYQLVRPDSRVYTSFSDQPPEFSDDEAGERDSETRGAGGVMDWLGCSTNASGSSSRILVRRGERDAERGEREPLISKEQEGGRRPSSVYYILVCVVMLVLLGALAIYFDVELFEKWKDRAGWLMMELTLNAESGNEIFVDNGNGEK